MRRCHQKGPEREAAHADAPVGMPVVRAPVADDELGPLARRPLFALEDPHLPVDHRPVMRSELVHRQLLRASHDRRL